MKKTHLILFLIILCSCKVDCLAINTSALNANKPELSLSHKVTNFVPLMASGTEADELPPRINPVIALCILIPLFCILFILFLYIIRHFIFAFNRLFGKQKNLYAEIQEAAWPSVSILIAAHNEETVIADVLLGILKVDYPLDKLQVIIVNDRSTDKTGSIVESFIHEHPSRFTHFFRQEGVPGKGAALADAMPLVNGAILLVFDADYVPGQFLIKELVCPFFDPEVGSVMGRVVPGNTYKNLLTRLLDLERSAGYQVNQQARENMRAIPQYGGTAGGIRVQALRDAGGWDPLFLAEDTEITFRLVCQNWLIVYQNNAECIELVPETWPVRIRQIKRWAKGHNQVMFKYIFSVLFNKKLSLSARIDGLFLLFTFLISPLLLTGWILFILTYFLDIAPGSSNILGFLLIISFSGAGNFTIFYEIATAAHLDNLRNVEGSRIRLLPFIYFNFFVNIIDISAAFIEQITIDRFKKTPDWKRTDHPSRMQ